MCQRSACDRPTFCQLFTKLSEGDRLAALYLGESYLQSRQDVGVGEDLGDLIQHVGIVDQHHWAAG